MLNRRNVLGISVSAVTATVLATRTTQAEEDSQAVRIVDTNVSLFQWPFRRLPLDEIDALVAKLRSLGIGQAWAGSFEGLLHRDLSSVNARLAEACASRPELIAVGSVNPVLPSWESDLGRCIDLHKMPGIRLHPNYHGYKLDDPRFLALLTLVAAAKRFVQIAVAMEDTRTQHELLRATDVDPAPLAGAMTCIPDARVQLLNFKPRSPQLETFAKIPNLFFDTSRVEGTDGVPELVKRLPAGRVLFGSHAPFLIPEAALIRVHESGQLDNETLGDLLADNAARMVEGTRR